MQGAPRFVESQALPDLSYADFATGIGLVGITVDRPEQVGPAWEQALGANRPAVIDVHCDPSVPPIPPHTTFEQMKDAAQSRLKGDVDRWQVLKEGLRAKAQEMLPRPGD